MNAEIPFWKQKWPFWNGFAPTVLLLSVILSALFWKSFVSGMALSSNDGPLGVMTSRSMSVPEGFTGAWHDLYFLGTNGGTLPLSLSYAILLVTGPIGFAKFYAPLCLLFLGLCAWIFARTIGLNEFRSMLMAIAAALNGNFFSNATWGLGSRSLTCGWALLAVTLIMTRRCGNYWVNAALAGICTGNAVVEGADNGAIFSLFIAAFLVFDSFNNSSTLRHKLTISLRMFPMVGMAIASAAQVLGPLMKFAGR